MIPIEKNIYLLLPPALLFLGASFKTTFEIAKQIDIHNPQRLNTIMSTRLIQI
jgi:hypothetical protein